MNFPLSGFPTFAFSLNYFPCHLVLMLMFNVCLFPPVTYIIYLNSITILGWRTKGSVESVTLWQNQFALWFRPRGTFSSVKQRNFPLFNSNLLLLVINTVTCDVSLKLLLSYSHLWNSLSLGWYKPLMHAHIEKGLVLCIEGVKSMQQLKVAA